MKSSGDGGQCKRNSSEHFLDIRFACHFCIFDLGYEDVGFERKSKGSCLPRKETLNREGSFGQRRRQNRKEQKSFGKDEGLNILNFMRNKIDLVFLLAFQKKAVITVGKNYACSETLPLLCRTLLHKREERTISGDFFHHVCASRGSLCRIDFQVL